MSTIIGKPVSGRTWKEPAFRTSSRIDVKTLHVGYAKRMEKLVIEKQQRAILKEMKAEVDAEKQKRVLDRKEREKRRLENERKNEVVQVITNARKLKRLKKKQLRGIVKR